MTGPARRALLFLLLLALIASPAGAALTASARVAAIYDLILDARFNEAETQLRSACPPAPLEACGVLRVVSIWWQINVNPESRLLDERLKRAAAAAIAAGEAWTKHEPERAESWFYLAGAYAPLVEWRVLRGERLAAARDAKTIKDALERALALDPSMADAYFGIGLYHYYADVAPTYAKLLRWLLLLPGGDRRKGLEEMLTARERGEVLKGEADYQLYLLYLWYENKLADALALLESLDARYPSNPLFLQRIAELHDVYRHDLRASEAAWRALLDRARADRVFAARATAIRARLGLAAVLIESGAIDEARDQLQIVIDAHPRVPIDAESRAQTLQRALRERRKF